MKNGHFARSTRKTTAQLIRLANQDLAALITEYQKLDLGNQITLEQLQAAGVTDLTVQQFVDGVAALMAIHAAVNTNGLALYRLSDGSQRP
jgi:hypothetical protein